MARPMMSFSDHLEKYAVPVTESGCFIWCGHISKHGYGRITKGRKKTVHAHRAAYEEKFGKVDENLVIRHICDVKLCVNVNHLIVGTQAENIADKVRRNRQSKGESHGQAKLTEQQAKMIKERLVTPNEANKMFGISSVMARQIRSGRYWKHI